MIYISEIDNGCIIEFNKENEQIMINIDINEFDTIHFGIKMATIVLKHTDTIDKINIEEIQNVFMKSLDYCKFKDIKHISLKTSSKNYRIIHAAENNGFNLVNVSVEYLYDYKKKSIEKIPSSVKTRISVKEDLNSVLQIAESTFKNFSRFHYDESLENEKADDLYQKWIVNSFNGLADKIIIAEHNEKVVGFCTMKNNFMEIKGEKAVGAILAGVLEDARGMGVYKTMINEAIIIGSRLENARYLVSSTQAQNIFVQRAWSDLGLKIYNCVYIFHKTL